MSKALKKPSTRIDEHDRLKLSLTAERAARLHAQHELAVASANTIAAQKQAHAEQLKADIAELRKKYALAETDNIDLATGNIHRAHAEAKPTAEKKES